MNRSFALSLFVVAALLASCEVISSESKSMQWDDPGARAGKLALVSLYADIQGLDPQDPDLARLESGVLRDILVAAEDALHEKFDVQPAKGFVADANYHKHAAGSPRGAQPMPSLGGHKMVRLTPAPDEKLPLHLAGQLASDLGVRYIAVLETQLSARMVEVQDVASIKRGAGSPVRLEQRQVFAKTRLSIYNRSGFPVVVAESEGKGGMIEVKGRLVEQFKARRDSSNSASAGACDSAAAALRDGVKAIMDRLSYTANSIDYDG
ncbi:MAG: hypothetical protein H6835_06510 [Planctomycetes bacterium]|nr:hypothetical protein [Planctomycetota bacterium]